MSENTPKGERVKPRDRQYPETREQLKQEVAKTGHSWDGIEEYDNPMPRWWLWTFYVTIVWAIGYMILFPAWPLVKEATPGLLGYSTRANVDAEIQRFEAANETWFQRLNETELTAILDDDELQRFAVNAGDSVFAAHCSQCHGAGAAGVQAAGYPNLLNDAWLWGGTIEDIHQTIAFGIRNEDYDNARHSVMPAFGEQGILDEDEIEQVVQYVRQMSGQDHDADLAAPGEEIYAAQCVACHAEDGGGMQALGAPALNDAVWLYGGDEESLRETIQYSRFGVMPGFHDRLREAEIRAVATYVHQLGGGQ